MSLTVTLRPSATSSSTGWSAQPSGTLHGVTSDNSDSTYALWSGSGLPLVLQTPIDAPGVGLRRHQVRARVRGQLGDAWWGVRLQDGFLTAGATRQFPALLETSVGAWGFGAPPDGNTILAVHIEGQSTGLRVAEVYLDVDFREKPDFTGQVIDSGGAITTTITGTSTPTLRATAFDLDDLPVRQFRFWVTSGATIVWDSGIVDGPPVDTATTPLANGSYTAHYQIWTTLGGQYEYASDEKTVAFTVSVGQVQRPNDPTVTQIPGTPLWEISVCAPDVRQLDGDVGYIEVQRVECGGTPVTIAMLGPLATDECATYTDFSAPRTGLAVDASCDHGFEQCCSYYRVRAIGRSGSSVLISAWSDSTDPGVPRGLIFAWPSTVASIPAGWSRQTALDSQYLKGAPAGQQPGTRGGAISHSHTLPVHNHDITHSHTFTGNTSAATGSATTGPNTAGTITALASHVHAMPASTSSTSLSSGDTAPTTVAVTNNLSRANILWIESNGSPAGIPNGALGLAGDLSLAGWTDYATATGRYLKGAAPGDDGNTTGTSSLDNHTHGINGHTHTGPAHTHTSSQTAFFNSTVAPTSGATNVLNNTTHAHTVTVASAAAASLASANGGISGPTSAGTNEPPFINVRVKQNTSGGTSLPVGIIGAWRGSLGTIPEHFALCDGTNGTPDLRARHPKGATTAIGTTGGSLAPHTHSSGAHTHTTTGHSHTVTIGAATEGSIGRQAVATITATTATHTHTHGGTDSTTPTVTSSSSGTLPGETAEPPHEEVAFVQLVEPFTPASPPETFCLTWSDDEHLIRTTSADGALWAPIAGRFTWDRERPFSSAFGVNGTRFTDNATPGERNHSLSCAVESQDELDNLLAVLSRPLVLISPSDSREVWAAPVAGSLSVVKVGRIRQVSIDFIGTGPQPGPQVADI